MTASYAQCPSDTPLLWTTIGDSLRHVARSHGGRDALVSRHQDIRLSYDALQAEVTRVAAGFIALGIGPGDRVAVWSAGCAEWVIAQYAAAATGAILVSINPSYRAGELEYVLALADASLLIAGRRFGNNDSLAVLTECVPGFADSAAGTIRSSRLPSLRTIVGLGAEVVPGTLSWSELARRGGEADHATLLERSAAVGPDDPALILFTSGTTGRPKGVLLSHHNVINGGFFVGRHLRYTADDRVCLPLPLYHVLGCVAASVAAMTHGAALIIPSDVFDAGRCLEAIEEERCTALYGVPTMFLAQLEHPRFSRFDVTTLRTGVISGAACPSQVMRRVVDNMHLPELTVGYGMTEMAPILYTSLDDDIEDRAATAGTVQPHVECKIVDPVSGRVAPRGQVGELCARGYCQMLGYWKDPEATRAVVDEAGWMHTGDLAVMREDGYVSIVGRSKDMIIRGGENISPREIEELLHTHPKVHDVHVVGVPDRQYGEEICAWVRLRPGADADAAELRRFCRANLAAFKIPRYVCFTEEFPMTRSGKVQKFRLRELAADLLGLKADGVVAAV